MKKFLIIGSANAITYKEIFPYIASGEWFIRSGNGKISFIIRFINSDGEEQNVPSLWYTNLDSRHLYKTLELTKKYDERLYPKYDNYDAIEVSRIKDIPYDYDGCMGVPISIVLFSPYQFEIIWTTDRGGDGMIEWLKKNPFDKSWDSAWINGQKVYKRILIKRVSK